MVKGKVEPVERAHGNRKSGDRGVDRPSASVDAEGVLFRDIIFVLRMSFVAPELPGFGKEGPEECDQFPGPQLAGLFFGLLARSEVRFLVVDDGLGDVSTEKVLPADGLLMLRCSEQCVVALEAR